MKRLTSATIAMFVAAAVLDGHPDLVRDGIRALPETLNAIYKEFKELQILVAGILAIVAAIVGWHAIQKQISASRDAEDRRLARAALGRAMQLVLALEEFTVQRGNALAAHHEHRNMVHIRETQRISGGDVPDETAESLAGVTRATLKVPPVLTLEPADLPNFGLDFAFDFYRFHTSLATHKEWIISAQTPVHDYQARATLARNLITLFDTIMEQAKDLKADMRKFIDQRQPKRD